MAGIRHSGLYRKICSFQKNTPVIKGAGKADSYSTFYATRGYLDTKQGGRSIVAGQIVQTSTALLYVRFKDKDQRRKFEGKLGADTKVKIEGVSYTIVSVTRVDEKYFEMLFNLNVI